MPVQVGLYLATLGGKRRLLPPLAVLLVKRNSYVSVVRMPPQADNWMGVYSNPSILSYSRDISPCYQERALNYERPLSDFSSVAGQYRPEQWSDTRSSDQIEKYHGKIEEVERLSKAEIFLR